MLFNYHTHTKYCGHAKGELREYVETAIENGVKTLGFSDHSPFVPPLRRKLGVRMAANDVEAYVTEVRSLAKEYSGEIRILCGVELEYFPSFHEEQKAFLKPLQLDYCILGQHYIGENNDESNLFHVHNQSSDDRILEQYVTQAIQGMKTGDFLYLAHPDMAGFAYSDACIEREYRKLCTEAKRLHIPLELNLWGLRGNRCYPNPRFFRIAAEVGNDVIIGADAHSPEIFAERETEAKALEMVEKLGLRLIKTPIL